MKRIDISKLTIEQKTDLDNKLKDLSYTSKGSFTVKDYVFARDLGILYINNENMLNNPEVQILLFPVLL